MTLEIRSFGPDDRPAGHALRVMAFSPSWTAQYPDAGEPYVPDERRLGAWEEGRLLAQAGAWRFGQWLLGTRVSMAGVAGVVVAPQARGRGLAVELMRRLVVRCHDDGDAIATLDPTVPSLYRQVGFANAGVFVRRSLPTAELVGLPRPERAPDLRPMDAERDPPAVAEVWRTQASRSHGRLDRSEPFMRRDLEPDEDLAQWVAVRDSGVVGYLAVEKLPTSSGDRSVFTQTVSGLCAADRDTWLALWRVVGGQASVCSTTTWASSPAEPLLDELSVGVFTGTQVTRPWMTRVLDVPGAVASRGWPSGVAEVVLRISDPLLAANDGAWRITLTDGTATASPAPSASAELDIGAFSALYTGYASASSLAWQGRLRGASDTEVATLNRMFTTPTPFLVDHF